ncbi:MAG: GNAT family N-acetyltransferase [Veillonella sp.]|jgi:phosphinothricin acetyltransferase|uniref:GNAT family N-acetyltransferase n=1 Tax=Veillonella sp. TaxID=1926307 RepID=UPI001B55BDE5|nr:GNAT family N-acetyltransferase [Veillonella sp.]MBK7920893.1 GNAT family N-acetyltransferase [Veillonella sp.]MBP6923517.1 GNAT family N-acetyltransferase [Veillonella sp.]MBP9516441.1 GNAT family N-acetyltransferase [Veillonella sp.]
MSQISLDNVTFRVASVDDAQALLDIYAYYVNETAITFEYDVPRVEEFQGRIRHTLQRFPYIVAELNGKIVGYAYTEYFKPRSAYDWAVETTIYLQHDLQKMGLGKKLYSLIEEISRAQHIINLNACIGYPIEEDAYLTKNSVQFHEYLGYRLVGEFVKCGYKFNTWYNMIWMEKFINDHPDHPETVIPFLELPDDVFCELGIAR